MASFTNKAERCGISWLLSHPPCSFLSPLPSLSLRDCRAPPPPVFWVAVGSVSSVFALSLHPTPRLHSGPGRRFLVLEAQDSQRTRLSCTSPLMAHLSSWTPSFLQAPSSCTALAGLPPCLSHLLPSTHLGFSLPYRRFVPPGSWLCEEGPRFSGPGLFGGPVQVGGLRARPGTSCLAWGFLMEKKAIPNRQRTQLLQSPYPVPSVFWPKSVLDFFLPSVGSPPESSDLSALYLHQLNQLLESSTGS